MADQLPDQVTAENLHDVLFMLYKLDQAPVDDVEANTIKALVWDWAKGIFEETEIKVIQTDPDKRPFLELAAKILIKVNKQDFKLTSQSEVVENWKDHQKQLAEERKREALAKLAKGNKQHIADKLKLSMAAMQRNTLEKDPESAAPQIMEAAEITITPDALFSPVETTTHLASVIETTSTEILEATYQVTPFVENVLVDLVPEVGALEETLAHQIQDASPKAPEDVVRTSAAQTIAYSIVNPEASPAQVADYIENVVVVGLEAKGYQATINASALAERVASLNLVKSLDDQLTTVVASELETQVGLDPETAKRMARIVVENQIPYLSYQISKAGAPMPNESPEKRSTRQKSVFENINKTVLGFYSRNLPQSAAEKIARLRTSLFSKAYDLVESSETVSESPYQRFDPEHRNPAIDYLASQGQSYLQDEALKALGRYIFTPVAATTGGVVGGIAVTETTTATALATIPALNIFLTTPIVVESTSTAGLIALNALENGYLVQTGVRGSLWIFNLTPEGLKFALASKGGSAAISGLIGSGAGSAATATTTTALTTAATTEAGAAVGATTGLPGGPLGVLIGAIIGYLVANIPKFISWAKKTLKEYFLPVIVAIVGGIIGLVGGFGVLLGAAGWFGVLLGAAGGFVGGLLVNAAAGPTGVTNILQPVGQVASSYFSGLASLAVTQVVVPLLVIFISIPILVALFLFIINNSAYIVPTSSSPQSSGIGGSFPPGPGGAYPVCWPVHGSVTQGPFCETHTDGHCPRSNSIDIGGNVGDVIYATHDGVVSTHCGDVDYGNCATVTSPLGFRTLYAHMINGSLVSAGTPITAGTALGFVGSSGGTTGPHLHYQLFAVGVDIRNIVPNYISMGPTSGCLSIEGGSDNPDDEI